MSNVDLAAGFMIRISELQEKIADLSVGAYEADAWRENAEFDLKRAISRNDYLKALLDSCNLTKRQSRDSWHDAVLRLEEERDELQDENRNLSQQVRDLKAYLRGLTASAEVMLKEE